MKTMILTVAVATLLLCTNCMNAQTSEKTSKTLIVYYSKTGNTEAMAKQIQELTGAELFQVETVKTYPEGYRETTEVAKEEKNNNDRPQIRGKVENIGQYDTIFIGFPIWWGTYPMAMATFLESYDLEGKTVIPFCTHGGGGVDQGFKDVEKLTPKSAHKEGLSLNGNDVKSAKSDVEKWVEAVKK